ncbi:similar to CYCLIN A1;2 [Actinidia rufa]|uniref:Similar to CYCLIN A12 n=1 Tax=Actinidia rufa TaxID=165716 RepID=A0A7J0EG03_9ERIC|nr:similar to CYCLIN A1;2 [Actinidia rufa]
MVAGVVVDGMVVVSMVEIEMGIELLGLGFGDGGLWIREWCGLQDERFLGIETVDRMTEKRPRTDYLERVQNDINASMRAILIDWLVETEEYSLASETLFLMVNYIDRYLFGNVLQMESAVLNYLKFEMTAPTARCFLR